MKTYSAFPLVGMIVASVFLMTCGLGVMLASSTVLGFGSVLIAGGVAIAWMSSYVHSDCAVVVIQVK